MEYFHVLTPEEGIEIKAEIGASYLRIQVIFRFDKMNSCKKKSEIYRTNGTNEKIKIMLHAGSKN